VTGPFLDEVVVTTRLTAVALFLLWFAHWGGHMLPPDPLGVVCIATAGGLIGLCLGRLWERARTTVSVRPRHGRCTK
jgi:hypothetical protein